jgi:CBS domain-containing protein
METNPNPKMVSEVMTRGVEVIGPGQSMREAAQKMDEFNIGVLPVCDGVELVGVITDRDMVIRGVASGAAPDTCTIAEVMTPDPEYCYEDEAVEEATEKMAAMKIRRIFVLNRDKSLVGVLSLGDVAVDSLVEPRDMADTLKTISEPARPERPAGSERRA